MEASSQVVKSPDEIEEGISSTQTVTWDPFSVFPKEIYVEIFDKLDSPVDKQNFINAHAKWYELFKAKRTLFLFQDVFKEIDKVAWKFLITEPETGSIRLVCQDWDGAVQNYFQHNESNFKLDTFDCKCRFKIRKEVFKELTRVGRKGLGRVALNSHFAWIDAEDLEEDLKMFSVTHPPSRNPFLSRKLCLFLPSLYEEDIQLYVAAVDTLLEIYGRHIWHCTITTDLDPENCCRMAKWLGQMPELKTFVVYHEEVDWIGSDMDIDEFLDMELLPEMKNLVVLKSEGLSPVVFNKLFGNLKCLEKIQIRYSEAALHYLDLTSRETLKEAFFTPKDLQDFFNILANCESFPNLKTLSIKMEFRGITNAYLDSYEWSKISRILEEKFPALEDLSLRLPTAVPLKETLNLPKLKRICIALPHWASLDFLLPCKALEEIKVNYEHLGLAVRQMDIRIQRPRLWTEELIDREKTTFNVDLKTMWKSNVWDEFSKLRVLDVEVCEENDWNDYYRFRRTGERKSSVINNSFQSDESSEESDSSGETSDSDE